MEKTPAFQSAGVVPTLCGDLANALIDVIEKAVQISHDTIDEQTFQPFNDCVDDKVHTSAPFLEKGTTGDT